MELEIGDTSYFTLPHAGYWDVSPTFTEVTRINLEKIAGWVADIFGIEVEDIRLSGKYARIVPARSAFCYWAVREFGLREIEMARRLKLTEPAVSISMRRVEQIAKEKRIKILDQ